MSPARITALVDGIFAISMTLLAFQLQVPGLLAHTSGQAFLSGLHTIFLKALIYALSFVVLGVFWVAHHIQFEFVRRVNLRYVWLNIAFLLFIGFVPFSAALLGSYSHQQVANLVYGTDLWLCSVLLYISWEYASHARLLDATRVPRSIQRQVNQRMLGSPVFYILGIGASFIDTHLSIVFFAIPPIFSLMPTRLRRKILDAKS